MQTILCLFRVKVNTPNSFTGPPLRNKFVMQERDVC